MPKDVRVLYRHWHKHVSSLPAESLRTVIDDEQLAPALEKFIGERMAIWKKRQSRQEPPYTTDPILREFRFCNILRELDRQTIEYHQQLLPLRDDFALWLLNMFYARMVARPETLRSVGLLSFEPSENADVYHRLLDYPRPRYGTPYVFPVSTIMRSPTPTRELFVTEYLPSVMQGIAREIEGWNNVPVEQGVERILGLFGYNLSFLWTEVLIDVAYQYPERVDLFGRFPIGPGAAPTLSKIDSSQDSVDIAYRLGQLRVPSGVYFKGQPVVLSSENWEGVACEFRKYTNLSAGRGRRRYYK